MPVKFPAYEFPAHRRSTDEAGFEDWVRQSNAILGRNLQEAELVPQSTYVAATGIIFGTTSWQPIAGLTADLTVPGNTIVQVSVWISALVTNTRANVALLIANPGTTTPTTQSTRNEVAGFGTTTCGTQFATIPMGWDMAHIPPGRYTFRPAVRGSSGGSSSIIAGGSGTTAAVMRVTIL